MTKLGLVAAVCLIAGAARADGSSVRKLTVELEWHHVPRTADEDAPVSSQQALVPNAVVKYQRYRDGTRAYTIRYDDDVECSTYAEKPAVIFLTCGRGNAHYRLVQQPGSQARLEWITVGEQTRNVEQN